jgi:GNAT superfamily N-acetyltransferase
VELRPTTADDLEAMHGVFVAALGELFRSHRYDPPGPPLEVFAANHRHILDTGTSFVADEAGLVRGYGAAIVRGDDWFLSSLFIAPGAQGQGLGSLLLDAVWGDAPRRRTITDALQPVSNAVYGRRGLVPVTPILNFYGTPTALEPDGDEAPADVAAIDAAAYGFDRAVDHRYWERSARRTEWGDAYSYFFPGGEIGPVGGLTQDAAGRALGAELARARGAVRVRIPGTARPLVLTALRAGLRLTETPGLLLCSEGVEPPTALAAAGYTLF